MIDLYHLWRLISLWAIPLLLAISVHEFAHGWMAHLRGDHTAQMIGRLSLNPIHHIDPIGTIALPLTLLITTQTVFGWAKPMPVNEQALKYPRWDMALIAFAGPFSNFLMALSWASIGRFLIPMMPQDTFAHHLLQMCGVGLHFNLILAILNLMPIPPLDGSKLLAALLPKTWVYYYEQLEPYGLWILIFLVLTGILWSAISPIYAALLHSIQAIIA